MQAGARNFAFLAVVVATVFLVGVPQPALCQQRDDRLIITILDFRGSGVSKEEIEIFVAISPARSWTRACTA